jgi:hypothetical protein
MTDERIDERWERERKERGSKRPSRREKGL